MLVRSALAGSENVPAVALASEIGIPAVARLLRRVGVTTLDRKEDSSDTDLYMVAASGGAPIRLTTSKKPENTPRWSPDGRYLAFLSARDGKKPQVFLLDRRGGDAQAITDYKTGASAIAWSPDSSKLALLVSEPDPNPSTSSGQASDTASEGIPSRKPSVAAATVPE
jgi:Tol biopolymer transport system component